MKDLSILIDAAGEAEEAPPPPPLGIPKQTIPSWIRWPLRCLFLPFVLMDISMQRLAAFLMRTPYRLEGNCLKRGNCCHYILMQKPKGIFGRLHLLWNTEINGFYLRSDEAHESDGKEVLVMGCRYLQKDGSCRHYTLRPAVCRKWPLVAYFGTPRMLKGCGFTAIPRHQKKS